MATLWRKTMYHLGLAPEDEYDDYGYEDDAPNGSSVANGPGQARHGDPDQLAHRQQPRSVDQGGQSSAIGAVRPIRTAEAVNPSVPEAAIRRSPVVRAVPVASNAKPHALTPVSFNDAQELADKFKGSQPVIMNLQNADRDLARRLIDFASGLCYGVGGQMEKVANSVYLLTPSNVEVSAEERRRMQERGYSDQ